MAGELQPLDQQFPIVDNDGKPTIYFIRWAQQRQMDIGDSLTLADLENFLTAHKLQAGSGIGLAPDGDLNNSPTITAKVQEILDQISNVRGTVLYRGAAAWAGLAPGTAGQFLQTAGAGADPIWAAGGGGGGGSSNRTVAAGYVTINQTTFAPTLVTGTNVASIVRTALGRYRATFTTPLPSANYGVNSSGRFADFNDTWECVVAIDRHPGFGFTTTTIDFECTTTANGFGGTLFDPLFFSFEVYDAATLSSGGGITTMGCPNSLAATQNIAVNFYVMKLIPVNSAFTINKVGFMMNAAVPTAKLQPFVYASSAGGVPGALLGSGPQVTGVVAGYNEIPLSAPLTVAKGAMIFVGVSVTVAGLANLWCQAGGLAAFVANGGSTVPAAVCPAVSTFTTANQVYAFWAVT